MVQLSTTREIAGKPANLTSSESLQAFILDKDMPIPKTPTCSSTHGHMLEEL
jgi:hypothetical protein